MEQEQKQEIQQSTASGFAATEDELTKALAGVKTRVAELEEILARKNDEIVTLTLSKDNLDKKIEALSKSLAEAVNGYRSMVVQANPEIPVEMLGGNTIEAVGESLKQAKELVTKVKKRLETDLMGSHIPSGAPERSIPVFDLSPREKIRQGIETRK